MQNLDFRHEGNVINMPIQAARNDEYMDAAWGIEKHGDNFSPMNIPIPKPIGRLVQIQGIYSGICHTDLHHALNQLGGNIYPIVPGHELIGKVIAVGDDVTKFKVGDIAGIAALTDGCLNCDSCKAGDEQYCEGGWQATYSAKKIHGHYGGNQDTQTFGGYSSSFCHDERMVCKIPSGIDLAKAAPLLCAGITMYDPLKFYGCLDGPKKTVGIIGIGGLGTMGIKLAKAMGHRVVAISTSAAKEQIAKAKGADIFVVSIDQDSMKANSNLCDLIINTVAAPHQVEHYLSILKSRSTIVQLGIYGEPHTLSQLPLIFGRKAVAGSLIGGIGTTEECLEFCFKNNIYPDIQIVEANQIDWVYQQLTSSNQDAIRYVIDIEKSKANKDFMPK